MSTQSNKKAPTGVRYTDEQKKNIVDFVVSHNLANGRGGQSAASKKFKVGPITIAAWLKKSGAKAKVAKVTNVTKVAAKKGSTAAPAGLAAKVASLVEINEQVRQAETQLGKLYTRHDSIMASIKSWV
jgi:hypothetical protein